MKNLIFGYYDLNFGDDWLIDKYVSKYKVSQAILVLSDPALFKPFEGDNRYRYVGDLGKKKAFRESEQIDIVGGSMFQEGGNWFKHYLKLFIVLKLAKILKKRVTAIGCNLDEPKSKIFKLLLKNIFISVDHFRVRDEKSYSILTEIYGVNKFNIELAYDLADDALPIQSNMEYRACSVSIINNKKVDKDEYFLWLLLQIETMYKNNNVTDFVLFGFDSGKESDESAIDDFINFITMRSKCISSINISKHIYDGHVSSFIDEWQKNKFAVCTRFHSYILARNSNQIYKIYGYSAKIKAYIITHHDREVMNLDAT